MVLFVIFYIFSSILIISSHPAFIPTNVTLFEDDIEFSSCSILKSKYEILKLRLDIIQKFGHYVPEIYEKIRVLENKFEKLYESLQSKQRISSKNIEYVNLTTGKEEDIELSSSLDLFETTEYSTEITTMADSEKMYINETLEEPEVCKIKRSGKIICTKLVLPNSCLHSNEFNCIGNLCKIRIDNLPLFTVACNEGWIVIQRRMDGSENFNRNWFDYKNGFGDLNGEFWLGLEKLYKLLSTSSYKLKITMEDFEGNVKYAEYDKFVIGGEDSGYLISTLGSYSGDAGDSLGIHAYKSFSTFNNDNDKTTENCAYLLSGGWWFYNCDNWYENSNLNGKYYQRELAARVETGHGIKWTTYRGKGYSLKYVEMAIKENV